MIYIRAAPPLLNRFELFVICDKRLHRQITVHWSSDNWQNSYINCAKLEFTEKFANGKEYEVWVCTPFEYMDNNEDEIEFSVCMHDSEDNEIWDNNNGRHYHSKNCNVFDMELFGSQQYLPPWG